MNTGRTRFKKGQRGENCVNWKGGKQKTWNGYIVVFCPQHIYGDKHGYVREHRLVMEKQLGRYLLPKEKIHHINGIKDDNRIENLELMESQSEHLRKEHKLGTYKKHLDIVHRRDYGTKNKTLIQS